MFVGEAALIIASYLAAFYLEGAMSGGAAAIGPADWQRILVLAGVILAGMYFRRLYADIRTRSRILLFQELSLVMGIAFIAEALLSYGNLDWALGRAILLPGSAIALACLYSWRILVGPAIQMRLGLQRVLFVGFSPSVNELAAFLDRFPDAGFASIGYLEHSASPEPTDLARLGSPEELMAVIETHRPAWIVVGERTEIGARQIGELVQLRFSGMQIEDAGAFFERIRGRLSARESRPSELVLSEAFRPSRMNLTLQTMYSTLVALLVTPLLLPLIGIIALVIRLRSGSPALVGERCLGLGGVPFKTWRFRTGTNGSGVFVRSGWNRLPQIFSVLRGEMSLVGPQADRSEFAQRLNAFIPLHAYRLLVRPGIISWAQLQQKEDGSGHNVLRRLEYDLYYIKNLSPVLDTFVLLRWLRGSIPFAHTTERS